MLTNRNRNTSTSNIRLLFAPFDIVEVILFQGLQKSLFLTGLNLDICK